MALNFLYISVEMWIINIFMSFYRAYEYHEILWFLPGNFTKNDDSFDIYQNIYGRKLVK